MFIDKLLKSKNNINKRDLNEIINILLDYNIHTLELDEYISDRYIESD